MKKFCKNKDTKQQVALCNKIIVLILIAIIILVTVMIIDLVHGDPIDGARCSILCCDVSILCFAIHNRDKALKSDEEEIKEVEDKEE